MGLSNALSVQVNLLAQMFDQILLLKYEATSWAFKMAGDRITF